MLIRADWSPSDRKVRQFGALLALLGLGSAAWAAWTGRRAEAQWAAAGALLGVLSAAIPWAGRQLYRAWMLAALPIGAAVSWLLLAAAFYGLFTPLALLFRLVGRDALRLRRPRGESYWSPLTVPSGPSYLERLF